MWGRANHDLWLDASRSCKFLLFPHKRFPGCLSAQKSRKLVTATLAKSTLELIFAVWPVCSQCMAEPGDRAAIINSQIGVSGAALLPQDRPAYV